MRNNELTVTVGGIRRKVFMQDGFYSADAPTRYIHMHNYSEIHLVLGGAVTFAVGEGQIKLCEGELLVIPGGTYHGRVAIEENVSHTAFQMEYDSENVEKHPISRAITEELFREVKSCRETGEHSMISAFITLIAAHICRERVDSVKRISDPGFIIREFFSNGYAMDIKLSELATELCVSRRQAERLMLQYTGRSFRDELANTRVTMAKHLMKTTDMSLAEIASYVGYRSYAGFWKALRRADGSEQESV
ncbi:MAG: helix-turn-helix domain-containing protein [Clostridia bacterium]|nr:helix-turn-helix domain-containing protein [Clostridia bacterium]